MTENETSLVTSEHGVNDLQNHCENYHYYMITIKPNFKSYIKKSLLNSNFMTTVFESFMVKFCSFFKMIDSGIEYDSKGICHIHFAVVSKINLLCINQDSGFSLSSVINFKRGIYTDFRMFPYEDLDRIINYINKGNKTDDIMNNYRNNYAFLD